MRTHYLLIASIPIACGPLSETENEVQRRLGSSSLAIGALDDIDTVKPIGGGENFNDWELECSTTIRSLAQLEAALATVTINSIENYVICVDDDAVIDLSDRVNGQLVVGAAVHDTRHIPRTTTIASHRGRNGSIGALLVRENHTNKALFSTGDNVRITGLRIQGPDPGEPPPFVCQGFDPIGIKVQDATGVVIDNNELWAWPHAAVSVDGPQSPGTNTVSHNHIHHNLRRRNFDVSGCSGDLGDAYGLGYGVVGDRGATLIKANLFDHNRHNVASTGRPNTDYTAQFNIILDGATDSSFDVHGGIDNDSDSQAEHPDQVAGTTIRIISNSFLENTVQDAFLVRGVPENVAEFAFNETRCAGPGCGSHPDQAARRSATRGARSVSAIAVLHRSLKASARS